MLFPPASQVDEVWAAIAHATANNELGIAAKVELAAPAAGSVFVKDEDDEDNDDKLSASQQQPADPRNDRARLICVYTSDFANVADVGRVLHGLRDLGLVQPGRGRGRDIYYKTGRLLILFPLKRAATQSCPSLPCFPHRSHEWKTERTEAPRSGSRIQETRLLPFSLWGSQCPRMLPPDP
jgi:hypothetical protein